MAKHDERDGDGKFKTANRDDRGFGPGAPPPPTISGTQVKITGEPGSGGGRKGLDDLNTYVRDSEYSSAHNYDVGQQDADKSRSR
jgi:hypothetical protein